MIVRISLKKMCFVRLPIVPFRRQNHFFRKSWLEQNRQNFSRSLNDQLKLPQEISEQSQMHCISKIQTIWYDWNQILGATIRMSPWRYVCLHPGRGRLSSRIALILSISKGTNYTIWSETAIVLSDVIRSLSLARVWSYVNVVSLSWISYWSESSWIPDLITSPRSWIDSPSWIISIVFLSWMSCPKNWNAQSHISNGTDISQRQVHVHIHLSYPRPVVKTLRCRKHALASRHGTRHQDDSSSSSRFHRQKVTSRRCGHGCIAQSRMKGQEREGKLTSSEHDQVLSSIARLTLQDAQRRRSWQAS